MNNNNNWGNILNKKEQNFIDDLVDLADCSNCPCGNDCHVTYNEDCFLRIADYLKSKIGK